MSRKLSGLMVALLVAGWLAGGCKSKDKTTEQPKDEKPRTAQPSDKPITPLPSPIPSRDEFDSQDPRVAGLFPKTGQAGEWVKVTEVKLYAGSALKDMVENLSYYTPYQVDWAADARYQLGDRTSQGLLVQLFHCADSASAFALMSVSSAQPAEVGFGPGTETRGGEPAQLHLWKGRFYLTMRTRTTQPASFKAAMERLLIRMAAALPAEDGAKSDLLEFLPPADRITHQTHHFRGSEWLAASDSALAGLLKLESQDELALAAYQAAGMTRSCVLFVARYETVQKAIEARSRLNHAQAEAATALGMRLMVGGQKNRCVFGTLTAEQYRDLERAAHAAGRPDPFRAIESALP